MERYLNYFIADQVGIASGLEFPFPNAFLSRLVQELTGEPFPADFSHLHWQIWGLLDEITRDEEFAPVRAYLEGRDDRGKFLFCKKAADLMDRYLVHRNDMVRSWSNEKPAKTDDSRAIWQQHLWRWLFPHDSPGHPLRLLDQIFQLETWPRQIALPDRLSLFGITTLPPLHLHLLLSLSRFTDIHYFYHTPIPFSKLENAAKNNGAPLLKSWGKSSHAFLTQLSHELFHEESQFKKRYGAFPDFQVISHSVEHVKKSHSALGQLQQMILMDDALEPDSSTKRAKHDESLKIHCCHNPLREVEVVKDEILRSLESDKNLSPSDILVMATDMELYAPFIHAVFNADEEGAIAFSIADRHPAPEKELYEAIMALLEFSSSRFSTSDVLALLDLPVIRQRYGFHMEDLEPIEEWIRLSFIRWGMDANHIHALNLPLPDRNSFRAGLKRLLVGYAMGGDDASVYHGYTLINGPEGDGARLLGRWAEFVEDLMEMASDLQKPRTPSEWGVTLQSILEKIKPPGMELSSLRRIAEDFAMLDQLPPMDAASIAEEIQSVFSDSRPGMGFLRKGITFSSVMPMRSVPFSMIAILGMNEADFPARDLAPSFDLIAAHPLASDRSRHTDDRQLFLDTILSARDSLHISYVGRMAASNALLYPSTVVQELIYRMNDYPVIAQRLHGFHPDYFRPSPEKCGAQTELDSSANGSIAGSEQENMRRPDPGYSRFYFESALTFANPERYSLASLVDSVSSPEFQKSEERENLAEFFYFCRNPIRYYANRKLSVHLSAPILAQEDEEPFWIDPLDQSSLIRDAVYRILKNQWSIHDKDNLEESLYDHFLGAGRLPPGQEGAIRFHRIWRNISTILEFFLNNGVESREFQFQGPDSEPLLAGTRSLFVGDGYIYDFHSASLRADGLFVLWIQALLFLAGADHGQKKIHGIRYLCKKKEAGFSLITYDFPSMNMETQNAVQILKRLVDLFHRGEKSPVLFSPQPSLYFAFKENQKRDGETLEKIIHDVEQYMRNEYTKTNRWKPEELALFRSRWILDDRLYLQEFIELSRELFTPLSSKEALDGFF